MLTKVIQEALREMSMVTPLSVATHVITDHKLTVLGH